MGLAALTMEYLDIAVFSGGTAYEQVLAWWLPSFLWNRVSLRVSGKKSEEKQGDLTYSQGQEEEEWTWADARDLSAVCRALLR